MAKKAKKYPKQPKAGASKSTFEKWEKRCAEVSKYNATITNEKKAKESIKAKVQKMKERAK
ncbi:hypothetical protein [Runella limosa]|uniref:hypothetical protein n=1 Tax=Runella limosa TaxID=370978 RepID=UPI0003F64542|nr:hypothetical protein [Runella limosa]MCA0234158.1 hypothetical protein [Bacteroidota bacterium]